MAGISSRPRNEQVLLLKKELDSILGLVVHARESLDNELASEWAQKKLAVDMNFVRKLKELTSSYNSLTDCKVRLDKAEKAMEKDMTPEDEKRAVVGYLRELSSADLKATLAEIDE